MSTTTPSAFPVPGRLGNQLRTVALLGSLSVLLVLIGGALGPGFLWLFAGLALVMNIGAYYHSHRIVLRMHHAREIAPGELPALHRMTEELAAAAGVPKPALYLIDEPQPNAFATGRNPEHGVIAVTRGLLDRMSERELRGVIAHEMAHILNRDILVATVAAGIATAVSMIAQAGQFAAFFGGGNSDDEEGGGLLPTLLLLFVAPIAAMLIQMGISRSREYLADSTAARLTRDPGGLASALENLSRGVEAHPVNASPATASLFIMNPLGAGQRLANLFSTHPALEERVRRLRSM